ncbi:septum formation family protein [Corynebacterium sp. TAE3-ERU12]|uniref:septum formation family protein n=1 Tax=Corynebacterium sp. TAE3-ERU12 TaxID=2849491 RepID=UPI001C466241|nr:septum formation family protein [Corynebacterium sp. TAE3-ERU12]MBV7296080.1 septum formation family protein [Corynebacterium sp. TAE3-ERU12]
MNNSGRYSNGLRGGWGLRAVSAAMLIGGGITAATGGADLLGVNSPAPTPSAVESTPTAATDPFTAAEVGQCLNWEVKKQGETTDFSIVDCERPHRYEVSKRVDLSTLDLTKSMFPKNSPQPDAEQVIQLRDEVCAEATTRYLDGRFDPSGILSIAPMLPPQKAWESGDRTMLCGIQRLDDDGDVIKLIGPARKIDQAVVYAAGLCVSTDERGSLISANCGDPHLFESVGVVDLRAQFGDNPPDEQAQNEYLSEECTSAAVNYLGGGDIGDDALYNSTLIPFWLTVSEQSWRSGSYSTTCWLTKDAGDSTFSTLQGSVREEFTIDGAPPTPQPPRGPRRN